MALYRTQADAQESNEAVEEPVAVEVDVELRVPRGEMGDLPAGVAAVLAGIDGAEVVDVGEIDAGRRAALDI
jgi:hypothetical protein